MKRSITTNVPAFNTNRMVKEYAEVCYLPSYQRFVKLSEEHFKFSAELAKWRPRLRGSWGQIQVVNVEATGGDLMRVGAELAVKAKVSLGGMSPNDVEVQLFHGLLDNRGEIALPRTLTLIPEPCAATFAQRQQRVGVFGNLALSKQRTIWLLCAGVAEE